MSYKNENAAYDLSLFESTAVPLKKEPEKKKSSNQSNNQKQKNNVVKLTNEQIYSMRKRKHNPLKIAVGVLFGAVVTFVIATIIQGQVQLTELSKEIAKANKELSIQQSIYTEMQMKANAALSPSVIDEYAVTKLGMTKATNTQKEFVNLSEGDKAEIMQTQNDNIFTTIANAIAGLWS